MSFNENEVKELKIWPLSDFVVVDRSKDSPDVKVIRIIATIV